MTELNGIFDESNKKLEKISNNLRNAVLNLEEIVETLRKK